MSRLPRLLTGTALTAAALAALTGTAAAAVPAGYTVLTVVSTPGHVTVYATDASGAVDMVAVGLD
ncbi:hypothetical protein [Nocardiopsis trehalosi]|jgi:hypothetical protein|uniref:hypothetical protein n=1 Tax=Nocardiopsis trehalosi TaxID=109329 RepID=UPI00082E33D6|nr:hypothetical protein [Nocardiopsis trehalosi]